MKLYNHPFFGRSGRCRLLVALAGAILLALPLAAQQAVSLPWSAQAEAGVLSAASIAAARTGFSGDGYVTIPAGGGAQAAWSLVLPKTKMYTVILRLACQGNASGEIWVDGEKGEKFKLTGDGRFQEVEVPNNFLSEGEVTLAVRTKSGSLDLDRITLRDGLKMLTGPVRTEPANSQSLPVVRRVLAYLGGEYGKHIISGQQDLTWDDRVDMVDRVFKLTGKKPALLGFDFLNYISAVDGTNGLRQVEEATDWWNQGGLVAFCWHWRVGSAKDFYTGKTYFRIKTDPASPEYRRIIADIDAIAVQLKRLEAAGVPILWRPLHEASGGWFWWGASGAEAYKALWRIMYDRLTNHHQLKNLIWVWNGQGEDWYPGDDTVDIIGWDVYGGDRQYLSWKDTWIRGQGVVKGDQAKLVTMSENGPIPDPDKLVAEQVPWSWFMTWNDGNQGKAEDDFFSGEKYMDNAYKIRVFNHPYVLTLDRLPDFKK